MTENFPTLTRELSCERDVNLALREVALLESFVWHIASSDLDWENAANHRDTREFAAKRLHLLDMIRDYDAVHNADRVGPCFPLTYSGQRFWPMDPRPEDFHIRDVAHSLANIVRFNGHAKLPYTVAQHSVRVSERVHPRFAYLGLMHDAPEGWCHDIVTPLKALLGQPYRDLTDRVWKAIVTRFKVEESAEAWAGVDRVDKRCAMTEARDHYCLGAVFFPTPVRPYDGPKEEVWPHDEAEQRFLERFNELAPEGVQKVRL